MNQEELKELYDSIIPDIRAVARDCGYAIAVHGSQVRDLDIVAIPWIEKPKPEAILLDSIVQVVKGYISGKAEFKPHGRKAYTIILPYQSSTEWSVFIDISIIPQLY